MLVRSRVENDALDCDKVTTVSHSDEQRLMKCSVRLSPERALRMEADVREIQGQTSPNEIAFSQRTMNADRITPQTLSELTGMQTLRWTGFHASNSICIPQGTHNIAWVAPGKAMHEDP